MRLQLRAALAVVGAVLLVSVLMPQGAQAQEAPSITVTPNTGLVDGQVIAVRGTGFVPDETGTSGVVTIVLVCPSGVLDFDSIDLFELANACGVLAGEASTDAAGDLSGTLQVAQVMPTILGNQVVECGAAPSDCTVFAGSFRLNPRTNPQMLRFATAFISFGAPTPQSKAACKNGGWRNLANDQGRPFRNQGRCVSYVVAHGR